jgi:anthranilate synthase component 2
MKVVLIDNYDSFAYNLYQALGELGTEVTVARNDAISVEDLERQRLDAIVISPGPGHPAIPGDFGVCREVLTTLSQHTPTLAVCLGHQGFALAYGGKVAHARRIVHGKTSLIHHDSLGIYQGIENPFVAGRYHSLIVTEVPPEITVSAKSDEGEIMGIRHSRYPIEGVQFHPESILTPKGGVLLSNFLAEARR